MWFSFPTVDLSKMFSEINYLYRYGRCVLLTCIRPLIYVFKVITLKVTVLHSLASFSESENQSMNRNLFQSLNQSKYRFSGSTLLRKFYHCLRMRCLILEWHTLLDQYCASVKKRNGQYLLPPLDASWHKISKKIFHNSLNNGVIFIFRAQDKSVLENFYDAKQHLIVSCIYEENPSTLVK